jgi:hypothetical protein
MVPPLLSKSFGDEGTSCEGLYLGGKISKHMNALIILFFSVVRKRT